MRLDLNCDLGEGCDLDAELLPLISSANVSCGFHAGDASTAWGTIELAMRHGVRVGAHPGFPDRAHFGRRELEMDELQVFRECVYQIGALQGVARALGVDLAYVKPHGALYNMAGRDDCYARPVLQAARLFSLPILGLPGSRVQVLAGDQVRFIAEGFADRRYQPNGQLVPRSQPDAFLESADEALRQAEWLIAEQGIETLCVHGDNPQALEFIRHLREALLTRGFRIEAFA